MRLPKIIKTKRFKLLLLIGGAGLLLLLGGFVGIQNAVAVSRLHQAQKEDTAGKLADAKKTLARAPGFLVVPSVRHRLALERNRNRVLADNEQKLARAKQLLKENKTAEALALLKTIQQPAGTNTPSTSAQVAQVTNLQKAAQAQASSSGSSSNTGGSSSGGATTGGGSGGSSSTPPPPPPPPGPLSQITVTGITASPHAYSATECAVDQSVSFSTNGSGSVSVTWKAMSTKTSSTIDNPVNYTFSAAGSQTDSITGRHYFGLQPGDSYRISATLTSGGITTVAGPVTVSSCAAPQPLKDPAVVSNITHITPGNFTASYYNDSVFVNECVVHVNTPFSVDASGSVQAVYTLTSGSSGGATLYGTQRFDFNGAGSGTDDSYIRMPHLNGSDIYSVIVTLYNLADHSITGTAGPITTGCS